MNYDTTTPMIDYLSGRGFRSLWKSRQRFV